MGKATILVVEDDMLVRMGAVDIVLCCGYGGVDASDAAEAIRTLESRTDIGLVFTDVQMPGRMDGIQLSHYIHDRWPTVKLLVTSGATDVDVSMLPPGSHFLSKPYSEEMLVSELTRLLGDTG